jgi:hypothetical protein
MFSANLSDPEAAFVTNHALRAHRNGIKASPAVWVLTSSMLVECGD